jgi:hypothetical protein
MWRQPPRRRSDITGLSSDKTAVLELALVGEHVRVGVRGDGEVALADVLADPRPRGEAASFSG